MKNKISYRYKLLIKIISLLAIGFLLINSVMWIFFRNDVRNISFHLYYGKPQEAVLLIANYVGDPPSKIKARILVQSFNLKLGYIENDTVKWVVQRRTGRFPQEAIYRRMGQGARAKGMHGMGMGRMMDMMAMGRRWDVSLSENRVLSIIIPMHLQRRYFYNPFYFFFSVLIMIGIFIFLSLKKTLKPLDRIIEASDKIGQGDLSYRINYNRNDDFGKVANAFNTMAVRLSSMLSNQRELLQFISHELRTPLSRINLALELKDKNRSSAIIKDEITHIDALIGEVSELSRLDNIYRELNMVRINLVTLIQELIGKNQKKKIEFKPEVQEAWVYTHELLIKTAFSNLIENALKFSAKNKPIEITLSKDGENLVITVENSGPGLTEKEIQKIWQPFFRASNAIEKNIEGRGFGLVIVKKAIELSSGEVSVMSNPHGPTIFRVKLPSFPPSRT